MAGYSGTPLAKKLGIKDGLSIYIHLPPAEYFNWLAPLPDVTILKKPTSRTSLIHLFVRDRNTFQKQFKRLSRYLKKDGALWVSWPKKSSKVETDLDENIVREFGLHSGLVDVKVCAVSEVWSALKFVYRLQDR